MQPCRLLENRVPHADCAACNPCAAGGDATPACPRLGGLAGHDIGLEAFDVTEGQAVDLAIAREWADMCVDPDPFSNSAPNRRRDAVLPTVVIDSPWWTPCGHHGGKAKGRLAAALS